MITKYFKNIKNQGVKRRLTNEGDKKLLSVIAIIMSLYQLYYSTFSTMQPFLHYAIHLTFILVLAFLMYGPYPDSDRTKVSKADYAFALVSLVIGVYFISQIGRYLARWPQVDPLSPIDIIIGIIIVLFVIGTTKRVIGIVLPVIALMFLAYAFFGHNLSGLFFHRHILPIDILDQLVFTTNGIFTSPLAAASTYVFLFVLFGAFFANSGAGDFFFKFSQAAAGRFTGGAGKVAVLTSALFGMINGSPTANVATTGSFTIPMMKKMGYSPRFSGAVSAVAATGGGIMPPIMGTAAFLMVEMAGIPYIEIAVAAALPAILFYGALLLMVHFRAKKTGLTSMAEDEVPDLKQTLKEGVHFLIPIVVLIVMLIMGYTASLSAVAGIIAVIVVSWFKKETRMGIKDILYCLEQGALQSVVISLSCAIAGIVINALMITGLSGKLASLILSIGGGSLIMALLLTALLCTILGMGMPVAAAYALTTSLAIPTLYELGVAPMPAHLFVVYFSTLSAITPPVAVAAYAAAGIAEDDSAKLGWTSVRLGIVAFIVPFMFIFQPSLLLGHMPFSINTAIVMLTSMLGVFALSAGLEGWMLTDLSRLERLVLFAAGLGMMYPETITDIIGLVIFIVITLRQIQQSKSSKKMESTI